MLLFLILVFTQSFYLFMVTIFMSIVSQQSVNNKSIKILNISFNMSFYEF